MKITIEYCADQRSSGPWLVEAQSAYGGHTTLMHGKTFDEALSGLVMAAQMARANDATGISNVSGIDGALKYGLEDHIARTTQFAERAAKSESA